MTIEEETNGKLHTLEIMKPHPQLQMQVPVVTLDGFGYLSDE